MFSFVVITNDYLIDFNKKLTNRKLTIIVQVQLGTDFISEIYRGRSIAGTLGNGATTRRNKLTTLSPNACKLVLSVAYILQSRPYILSRNLKS